VQHRRGAGEFAVGFEAGAGFVRVVLLVVVTVMVAKMGYDQFG